MHLPLSFAFAALLAATADSAPANATDCGSRYPQQYGAGFASTLAATATVSSGVIIGTTTSLPAATLLGTPVVVNKFLGVPFAQSPPVRFTPPQPPAPWSTPIYAQAWKPACIQQFNYPATQQALVEDIFNNPPPPAGESEDCLYLNVYSPSTPPPLGGRAVMFWIYGGNLQFGAAGLPLYDGSAFAAYQDVIIVTIGYRTNVFGFPYNSELPLTATNLGFLDQHMALSWVTDNIRAFGGDPAKVTIMGESAGAFSVDALLTSPPLIQKPPFRAAILESGQISYRGYNDSATPTSFIALAGALGCPGSYASNLTCVRAANATTIQTIINQQALPFNPVVDNYTYVYRPALQRQNGRFARVPVLTGTNAQEGRVYELGQTNATVAEYGLLSPAPQMVPPVQAAFPVTNIPGYSTDYDVASRVFTDYIFNCPQALFANETAAQGVPVWRYLFNATFPNTQNFPGLGAYHSSEISIVFQTYPGGPVNPITPLPSGTVPSNVPATAQEILLSQYMNAAWATFAKSPTSGPGWARVFTPGGDLGVLGAGLSTGVTLVRQQDNDFNCPLFTPGYRVFDGSDVYGLTT